MPVFGVFTEAEHPMTDLPIRMIARCLVLAAALLAPLAARAQSALVPELISANFPYFRSDPGSYAQAYFTAAQKQSFPPMALTDISVAGDVVTARFDPQCSDDCLPDAYSAHNIVLPTLAPGSYTLKVVGASDGRLYAEYPLPIDTPVPMPPQQIYTTPAVPRRDSAFSVTAYLLRAFGYQAPAHTSVSGHVVTVGVTTRCGFATCPPPEFLYGPLQLRIPALATGAYTLRIVYSDYTPAPLLAEVPLLVGDLDAVPASTPATLAIVCLLLSFAAGAHRYRFRAMARARSGRAHA